MLALAGGGIARAGGALAGPAAAAGGLGQFGAVTGGIWGSLVRQMSGTQAGWRDYQRRHGGKQTPVETTYGGKRVKVRLDKPPTQSTVIELKDYDWSNPRYRDPYMQKWVTRDFTEQIRKYKTIRPNVHLQFSQDPPRWIEELIAQEGASYSVAP